VKKFINLDKSYDYQHFIAATLYKCTVFRTFRSKSLQTMIRYTPQNQLKLEGFEHPFEQELNPEFAG
jgi:hypothetical protein